MINQVMGCFFIFLHLFFHHFYVDFFHDSWLLPTGVDTLMDSLSTNIALTMLGGLQQALEWQNSFCKILTKKLFWEKRKRRNTRPLRLPPRRGAWRSGRTGFLTDLQPCCALLSACCMACRGWTHGPGSPGVPHSFQGFARKEENNREDRLSWQPGAPKHKGFAPKTCAAWSRCTGAEFSLTCCEPPGSNLWHVAEICTLYFCAHFLFA